MGFNPGGEFVESLKSVDQKYNENARMTGSGFHDGEGRAPNGVPGEG